MGRNKEFQVTCKDCLSDLDKDVLGNILSRLTTKEAVRMSILSKSWKHKWISLYNLFIKDNEFFYEKRSAKDFFRSEGAKLLFSRFVERVVELSQNIKAFHLYCLGKHDASRIGTWISNALSHGVESLKVVCAYEGVFSSDDLFNCTSLKNLDLELCCNLYFKAPVCHVLANLHSLHLYRVHLQNENSSDTLQFSFPILKTMKLEKCEWSGMNYVEFYVPRMTEFISCTNPYDDRVNDYSIKIIGAKIEKFKAFGNLLQRFIMSESDVIFADLEYKLKLGRIKEIGPQICQLVEGFLNVEKLTVSISLMMAIAMSKLGISPIQHYRLEHLVVNCTIDTGIGALFGLLYACPFLKFLAINLRYAYTHGYEDDYDYNAVEYVPSCFLHFLEEVKFEGFKCHNSHYDLAKYVVKNGIKLKKVSFSVIADNYRDVETELSTYPKGSSCLTLLVCDSSFMVSRSSSNSGYFSDTEA